MDQPEKPSERLIEAYLNAVLEAHRKGQTGRLTAVGHIQTSLHYALEGDPRLAHHMQMWLDAVTPRPIP